MKLEDVPNIILVASGKGGVGKTTVASDIARTAADVLDGVGLVDADITTPNSLQVLGGEEANVDGQRLSTHDALVPPKVEGVQLMSKGLILPDDVPVLRGAGWRAETVADYIQNVEWDDDTELVVIDSPPGSGEEIQVILSAVPITYSYVVTTAHPSSVRDAKKTHELLEDPGIPHSTVLNMTHIPAEEVTEHVLDGVDMEEIQGVGENTEESIRELIRESEQNFPLFDSDSNDVDIGTEIAVEVPYTSRFATRRRVWRDEIENVIGQEAVQ